MKTISFLLMFLPLLSWAELQLPGIFSNQMVLQRDQPLPVWGLAAPGRTVTVRFKQQAVAATADAQGRWRVTLTPEPLETAPQVMAVDDGTITRRIEDVRVGEVWLASGQSNMAWRVKQSMDADLEMLRANRPMIRLFKVQQKTSTTPVFSSEGEWVLCTPETAADFSAVAYYAGRDLQELLGVPVGLIQAAVGATPAIAWTRQSAFAQHPLLQERAEEWRGYVDTYDERLAAWEEALKVWLEEKKLSLVVDDPGISAEAAEWHQAAFNDFRWTAIQMPASIDNDIMPMNGAVWFRRRIELPVAMRGRDLTLAMGTIADHDKIWVNGVLVGETGPEAEDPARVDRRYTVPARLTRTGELAIAIRVFDRGGEGGFTGDAKGMLLVGSSSAVRLAGEGWVYKVESQLHTAITERDLARYPDAPKRPYSPDSPQRPASLANGMIATVAPFALRGVFWYQGEADTSWEPARYGERLRVMIEDWREWWENPALYFGVVQLTDFLAPAEGPTDETWPQLRESQRQMVRELPDTGLVVSLGLGEANDIHPRDKAGVALRLVRRVLTDVYERLELGGGPVPSGADFGGGKVVVSFDQAGGGLHILNGHELGGFTLAGADGQFHPAQARITGKDRVTVSAEAVADPVHLRYAWQNNPVDANLTNQERLPAGTFEMRRP